MQDVRAVESFALLNVGLRPDHLLRRAEAQRQPEHVRADGTREPQIVDPRDAVARTEDDIDEVPAAADLAEPMRERQLGVVPGVREQRERLRHVRLAHKDVKVFRLAGDVRVPLERECPAHEERHARAVQPGQRFDLEVPRGRRHDGRHYVPLSGRLKTRNGGRPSKERASNGIDTL